MTSSISEILHAKTFNQNLPTSSIEITGKSEAINSIELPAVIDNLIDNKMYRRKFAKLIREGHLRDLLELADLARDKDKPSHWFARATKTSPNKEDPNAPTMWQRSLTYLAKLRKIQRLAEETARRVSAGAHQMRQVYKACWKLGDRVLQAAIKSEETGKDRFKYFCWLTSDKGIKYCSQ